MKIMQHTCLRFPTPACPPNPRVDALGGSPFGRRQRTIAPAARSRAVCSPGVARFCTGRRRRRARGRDQTRCAGRLTPVTAGAGGTARAGVPRDLLGARGPIEGAGPCRASTPRRRTASASRVQAPRDDARLPVRARGGRGGRGGRDRSRGACATKADARAGRTRFGSGVQRTASARHCVSASVAWNRALREPDASAAASAVHLPRPSDPPADAIADESEDEGRADATTRRRGTV